MVKSSTQWTNDEDDEDSTIHTENVIIFASGEPFTWRRHKAWRMSRERRHSSFLSQLQQFSRQPSRKRSSALSSCFSEYEKNIYKYIVFLCFVFFSTVLVFPCGSGERSRPEAVGRAKRQWRMGNGGTILGTVVQLRRIFCLAALQATGRPRHSEPMMAKLLFSQRHVHEIYT